MNAKWLGGALMFAAMTTLAMALAVADGGDRARSKGLAEWFDHYGVRGTLVLCQARHEHCDVHNAERADQRFSPASTFKIVNALIGLETFAVRDAHETMAWDGKPQRVKAWEQDHDLASAMRVSAVWYYQELARRIGRERMQLGLDRMQYGNRQIGAAVDLFWLDGSLTISAREQLQVLRALHDATLPFDKEHQATVRNLLLRAQGEDFSVYAKTGWNDSFGIGWFVGWVEQGADTHYFALNIDVANNRDAAARINLIEHVLAQRGLIPAGTQLE